MKAVQVHQYGKSQVLEIVNDLPEPSVKSGQVLVEVHAASINPFDVKLLSGIYKDKIPIQFPFTPGGDFAGVVTKTGEDVLDYKEGDEVFGSALVLTGGSGSFAQKACVNIKSIAMKPKRTDFLQAASLPLVGASVIQALEEHIILQKSQKILIQGGAGGIGSIAIQLAKHIGAYVATTAGADDIEFVKNLGADQIINYKNENFEEILSDFDAVYDTVGGKTTDVSFKVLKKGGIIVSMVGQPNESLAKQYQVTAIGQNTKTNHEHLSKLAQYVDQGVIKAQVDKVFSLDQIKEAFIHLDMGSPNGKVVVKIKV